MKEYLFTDGNGVPYTEARLRGIMHEMYCNECDFKGLPYVTGRGTYYNTDIIIKPVYNNIALEIETDSNIFGTDKTIKDCIPYVFLNKLISREGMESQGWFDILGN